MKKILSIAACAALIGMAGTASAETIFSDNFNRRNSSTVGNNWYEIESASNDVAIHSGYLRLRDNQAGIDAAVLQGVSTFGYENITLDFSWGASNNTEPGDKLYVSWDLNDGNWTNIWQQNLGGSGFASVHLEFLGDNATAENQYNFRLRFYTEVNAPSEYAKIDDVVLAGTTLISAGVNPVPEPTTVLLFGTGIAGLAAVVRRKR